MFREAFRVLPHGLLLLQSRSGQMPVLSQNS